MPKGVEVRFLSEAPSQDLSETGYNGSFRSCRCRVRVRQVLPVCAGMLELAYSFGLNPKARFWD